MAATKTPAQIREYLRKQKWIRRFAKNMKEVGDRSVEEVRMILSGGYGVNTVAAGFEWRVSPQGFDYWYNIHKEFEKFYYYG